MRGLPPLRWAVVIANLNPVMRHEQGGERRCLVVSHEPFHRSGHVSVCPITASRTEARYPGEVPIPVGEAGQTKAGVILCHQVRTISLRRVPSRALAAGGPLQYVGDPEIRRSVREALRHHFGLDMPPRADGVM